MNKIKNMLIAVIAITSLSTAAFAGSIGIGVTGSYAAIAGEGKEADKTATSDASVRDANASNNATVGSIFVEYSFDRFNGLTFGYDSIPGSADVNSKTLSRTDSGSGDADATNDDRARTAQATIENIHTIYVELPLGSSGLYLKGGQTSMDVNTKETTNSNYGNTSVDGTQWGIGVKRDIGTNLYYKVEGTKTDFDKIKLNDAQSDKGSKIEADLDVTKVTFALAYKF